MQSLLIKTKALKEFLSRIRKHADNTTTVLSDISSAKMLYLKGSSGLSITRGLWIVKKTKPLEIKWPNELIKPLGVYFTYDQKQKQNDLEKNYYIERLDSITKRILK